MKRINDKIKQIKDYLKDLDELKLKDFTKYRKDKILRAACERYIEKIVEATTDLAFIIIKIKKLRIPEDDSDAFTILHENKIITQNLKEKLKHAKGMRNIIAHQYSVIDDEIVFNAAKNNLKKDIDQFLKNLK